MIWLPTAKKRRCFPTRTAPELGPENSHGTNHALGLRAMKRAVVGVVPGLVEGDGSVVARIEISLFDRNEGAFFCR